ncbi:MAG: hypothetical protein Q8M17_16195 [Actinomycetota bacterium]|nr:hypothetical protein [Actinomycetota bacterium]
MSATRYDLPHHAWRALYGAYVDYLLGTLPEMRDALVDRLGGQVGFAHWMLAIHDKRLLNVTTTVDGPEVRVSVSVPVQGRGPDMILFTLTGHEIGAGADWLLAAGSLRIDDELVALLGDGES